MKSDEELGLPWAGGQMEKRDLMGPSFIVEPLCGPGIPGGLPVIADWLLTQPSSFSVGEHKESTFPVTEFWPTACEWGNVYSKNAKMGSPRPNPCRDGLTATEPVVIHYLNTSRGKKTSDPFERRPRCISTVAQPRIVAAFCTPVLSGVS